MDSAAPAEAWTGIDLEWSMQITAGFLRIDYTVHNDTDEAIYLLDQVSVGGQIDPRAILVLNGDAPGVVVLARGLPPMKSWPYVVYPPVARHVDARTTAEGMALAPLPLRAYHNISGVDGLEGPMDHARLEIQYVVDRAPGVVTPTTQYETPGLMAASAADELWLVGHELPLPTEARAVDTEGTW